VQSFLARITPISDGRPDNSLPGQPPGISGPNDPRPTPPIYIPVPPPSGGGGGGGEHPEHPIYIPVYPAHPIVLPLPPTDARPMPPIYIPPGHPDTACPNSHRVSGDRQTRDRPRRSTSRSKGRIRSTRSISRSSQPTRSSCRRMARSRNRRREWCNRRAANPASGGTAPTTTASYSYPTRKPAPVMTGRKSTRSPLGNKDSAAPPGAAFPPNEVVQ